MEKGEFEFVNEIRGGVIPQEYIPSVEKGFHTMMKKGKLIGFPVTGLRVVLQDGQTHTVDSSDNAFQAAARGAFNEVYRKAKPQILEPIMRVSVEGPNEFQGAFVKTVMQRDVWLFHRSPIGEPGESGIHHGVLPVRPGAWGSFGRPDPTIQRGVEGQGLIQEGREGCIARKSTNGVR